MKRLVVNADDFGLTPGVCEAILRAAEDGIVTSTSALVVAPAWAAWADRLASSSLGVGIHLCLVGEDPPLLAPSEIPTLVDDAGRFPMSWRQFMARAALGRIDVDDVRRELRAQADLACASGARITHLDSHQNLHLWPMFSTVMFELSDSLGLRAARRTRSSRWDVPSLGVRTLSWNFARRAAARGLAVPEASAGLDEAGHLDRSRLIATVEALGASGARTAELATHPGLPDDPDRVRYEWGYEWPAEFAALCHPESHAAVERAGFELVDFGAFAPGRTGGTNAAA